jgi:hypothetical protein
MNSLNVRRLFLALLILLGSLSIPSFNEGDVAASAPAFVPLTPTRILNTRDMKDARGVVQKVGALDGSGQALSLQVGGVGLVPAYGIWAVALNVTVVDGEAGDAGGYVTVYPCGTRPTTSNLNFVSGQTIPNSVIAPVSVEGKVCFYVYGKAHLLADVSGYFPWGPGFTSLSPGRIVNTRDSGIKVGSLDGSGTPLEVTVTGKGGLPSSGFDAVALNVTVVDGEAGNAGGYVTVYPCGTRPDASNLNFVSGQTIPNSVIAPVSATGKVCFYVYGKAHLLADVSGFFGGGLDPIVDRSLMDVLSTPSVKWTKFEALQTVAGPTSRGLQTAEMTTLTAGTITFRTTDVIGLALPDQVTGSGLLAVTAAGISTDALLSGNATISNFYSAPNGKYYVLFQSAVPLVDGGNPCLLAEVNAQTGFPTCIDEELQSIQWSNFGFTNSPIQFDSSGNIYYIGTAVNGKTALRKYSSGQSLNLVNDNIQINDFLVLGDGGVIMTGSTTSSSVRWVRYLSLNNALSTLATGSSANFITKFADGNAYFGIYESVGNSVRKFDVSSRVLDAQKWIGSSWFGSTETVYNNTSQICDANRALARGFCDTSGASITSLLAIPGQKTFVVAGSRGSDGGTLMQYFPTVERATSVVRSVTLAQSNGEDIFLAGTDSNGTNSLTIYDTEIKQETILIDSQNEIEIYNMTYVPSTDTVMFNGLRFADNKFVVGEVSLS